MVDVTESHLNGLLVGAKKLPVTHIEFGIRSPCIVAVLSDEVWFAWRKKGGNMVKSHMMGRSRFARYVFGLYRRVSGYRRIHRYIVNNNIWVMSEKVLRDFATVIHPSQYSRSVRVIPCSHAGFVPPDDGYINNPDVVDEFAKVIEEMTKDQFMPHQTPQSLISFNRKIFDRL